MFIYKNPVKELRSHNKNETGTTQRKRQYEKAYKTHKIKYEDDSCEITRGRKSMRFVFSDRMVENISKKMSKWYKKSPSYRTFAGNDDKWECSVY